MSYIETRNKYQSRKLRVSQDLQSYDTDTSSSSSLTTISEAVDVSEQEHNLELNHEVIEEKTTGQLFPPSEKKPDLSEDVRKVGTLPCWDPGEGKNDLSEDVCHVEIKAEHKKENKEKNEEFIQFTSTPKSEGKKELVKGHNNILIMSKYNYTLYC